MRIRSWKSVHLTSGDLRTVISYDKKSTIKQKVNYAMCLINDSLPSNLLSKSANFLTVFSSSSFSIFLSLIILFDKYDRIIFCTVIAECAFFLASLVFLSLINLLYFFRNFDRVRNRLISDWIIIAFLFAVNSFNFLSL